jgi:AcrR family transcriptional regulator
VTLRRAGPRKGTAVSAKGANRVDAILDAATRVLVTDGAGALALRRVAADVGIALGNIQYYFPTQEALIRALLDRVMLRASEGLRARVAEHGEGLGPLLDALLEEHLDRDACRLFYELWALAARDKAVARALRGFYAEYVEAVGDALRSHDPAVSEVDALTRARLFVAGLEGLSLFRSGTVARGDATFDEAARRWLLATIGVERT